ncbi:MurR/RpiR family transcriptional regulator [Advenella kashmirensis]
MDKEQAESLIKSKFSELSPMLQLAAKYVVDHPQETALASMRQVAKNAGVQPSVMHRLAVTLEFEGYNSFRDVYRHWLSSKESSFSARAAQLQKRKAGDLTERLIADVLEADIHNLDALTDPQSTAAFKQAHNLLAGAKSIYVVGLRSMFPAAYYFSYSCGMFLNNTVLLSGIGGGFADPLRRATKEDALIVFSCYPYARDAATATRYARAKGTKIIAVSDSAVSPISKIADVSLIIKNETPSLFPSITPLVVVAQTLVAMLVASGGKGSVRQISSSETQLAEFDVYVSSRNG